MVLRGVGCAAQARMNGGTNIALSIKQAGQLLAREEPGTARIIVLLTDGRVDSFQGVPWPGPACAVMAMFTLRGGTLVGILCAEMREHSTS